MRVANARAIFIPSDWAFIFITGIDMAKWIFQQFLQTHYVLFGDQYVALYTHTEVEGVWLHEKSITEALWWCRLRPGLSA